MYDELFLHKHMNEKKPSLKFKSPRSPTVSAIGFKMDIYSENNHFINFNKRFFNTLLDTYFGQLNGIISKSLTKSIKFLTSKLVFSSAFKENLHLC